MIFTDDGDRSRVFGSIAAAVRAVVVVGGWAQTGASVVRIAFAFFRRHFFFGFPFFSVRFFDFSFFAQQQASLRPALLSSGDPRSVSRATVGRRPRALPRRLLTGRLAVSLVLNGLTPNGRFAPVTVATPRRDEQRRGYQAQNQGHPPSAAMSHFLSPV